MTKKATKAKSVLDIDTIHAAAVADEQHAFADEATQSVFGSLAESTVGYTDRKKWEESVRVIEDEYCDKVHSKTEGAMTKGRGKPGSKGYVAPRWKYRTLLPSAWSSSKSVCGQAIEHGIKMDADSKKTATEQAIKEKKEDAKVDKTPREKFKIAMDTAAKVLQQVDEAERVAILKDAGIDPSKSIFDWGV